MRLSPLLVALISMPTLAATNSLDHRFGNGGAIVATKSPLPGVTVRPYGIAIQSDGKIVIGGRVQDAPPSLADQPFIGRLNADGSWDSSFGDSGIFRLPVTGTVAPTGGEINHVAVMSDGHILATGGVFSGPSYPRFSTCVLLMKTDAAGVLDGTFAGGGDICFNFDPETSRLGHFESILLDASDGFYMTAPNNNREVAHFDKNGSLISGYGSGGLATLPPNVYPNVLIASGADLMAIGVEYESGSYNSAAAVRVKSDGSIDATYGQSGALFVDSPSSVIDTPDATLDASGRLLIITNDGFGANYVPYRFFRADAEGSVDVTFNPNGQQPGAPGNANLQIAGTTTLNRVDRVRAIPDGRIIAFGDVLEPNTASNSDVAIVRLNADSSFDTSFGDLGHLGWTSINIGPAGTDNFVLDVGSDDEGRLYVLTVSACPAILRLVPDTLLADGFDDESLPSACPE
jgi:uncharacterized delta-60 repeat protein